jgi:flotillin
LLTGESDGSPTQTAAKGVVSVAEGRNHVQEIVKGIIEGETRSIVSTMTMEELFRERKIFKDKGKLEIYRLPIRQTLIASSNSASAI